MVRIVGWSEDPSEWDRLVGLLIGSILTLAVVFLANQENGRAIDEGRPPACVSEDMVPVEVTEDSFDLSAGMHTCIHIDDFQGEMP